jgi:hypothetical protein
MGVGCPIPVTFPSLMTGPSAALVDDHGCIVDEVLL